MAYLLFVGVVLAGILIAVALIRWTLREPSEEYYAAMRLRNFSGYPGFCLDCSYMPCRCGKLRRIPPQGGSGTAPPKAILPPRGRSVLPDPEPLQWRTISEPGAVIQVRVAPVPEPYRTLIADALDGTHV